MQSIKAIYDGEGFLPSQPVPVQGRYEVIITFVEPAEQNEVRHEDPQEPDTAKLKATFPILGMYADGKLTVDGFLKRKRADEVTGD